MKYEGKTNQQSIADAITAADAYATKNALHRTQKTRFLVSLEEILLLCGDHFGEEASFSLEIGLKNGDLRVALKVPGEAYNPLEQDNVILGRVLEGFEGAPQWSHKKGCNCVAYRLQVYSTMWKNMRFSWKYMKGQRTFFFVAVSAQLFSVALSILLPMLSARIIVAYTNEAFSGILYTAFALLATRLVNNIMLFVANRSYNIVYNKTLSNLETDLVDSALRIKSECLDEQGTGLFIQRLTVDTTRLATGFNTLADMSATLLNYVGILAAMLILSPPVFLVVLALLGIQYAIEHARTKRMTVDDRIYREANERFTGFVSEMVKGASDVRLLNSEKIFKEELAARIRDANDKRLYMQKRSWSLKIARQELGALGYFGFILLLSLLIAKGLILLVTAIVLFNYYSELGITAITMLGDFMDFIRDYNLSAERVYALLSSYQFPRERFGKTRLAQVRGEIRFEHVRFAYKHTDPLVEPRPVLKDLDCVIPAGSSAAFVGRSGCGKSTALRLISRMYDTSGGAVRIDGVNVRELDQESLRAGIAVVSQQPYIFNLSVRDNLRLVRPDVTQEEMEEVCRLACIDDEIRAMPNGYDTLIGEGGTNMSGGQRQRLAIARALLRDFRILILDEATSALDNITQARIREALDNVCRDHTVIMVAHRLSTIVNVDRIFYIEDGRILDSGTHGELLAHCERYRALYETEGAQGA